MARPEIKPTWKRGASPSGRDVESTYAMTIYEGYTHTLLGKTIDFSHTLEVASLKSTMAATLNISENMRRLDTFTQPIKIMHVVTPPGHLPQNWGSIRRLADELGII